MSEIFPEHRIPSPRCRTCQRVPEDSGYAWVAAENEMTPDEYVMRMDATYVSRSHTYLCDEDYLAAEVPPDHWAIQALRMFDAPEGGESDERSARSGEGDHVP